MALLGFHFNKMSVDKKKSATGNINIKNNMTVTKIEEKTLNLGNTKQAGAEFQFTFRIDYEPKIATLILEGAVLYVAEDKKTKDIIKKWKKEKSLSEEIMKEVSLHIVSKCNLQAIVIARDMQLPPHIAMARVGDSKK